MITTGPGVIIAKNLSVNYVDLERHLPERDDRGGEMVERDETALKLLVAHQQFAEPVEPTMADLDHPTPRLLIRVAPLDVRLFAATDDVGNVVMFFDGACVVGTAVAGIGAQVLVAPRVGGLSRLTMTALRTSSRCLQSLTFAPLTMSENGTPRPSTNRWRLLPFFPPIRRVRPDGFLCQWRLHHRAIHALPPPRDALHVVVLGQAGLP